MIVLFIIRYKVGFMLGTSEDVSEGLRKTNDCLTLPNISLSPTHKTLFHIIITLHEEHLQPSALELGQIFNSITLAPFLQCFFFFVQLIRIRK